LITDQLRKISIEVLKQVFDDWGTTYFECDCAAFRQCDQSACDSCPSIDFKIEIDNSKVKKWRRANFFRNLTVAMVTFPLVQLMESPVKSSMSPLSPFVIAEVPRDTFPLTGPLESAARPLFNTISPLLVE